MEGRNERRKALVRLSDALAERGITARGVRNLPEGPALMVLGNLIVGHDGVQYRWLEGRAERAHPAEDMQRAAEAIAGLAKRFQGSAFHAVSPPGGLYSWDVRCGKEGRSGPGGVTADRRRALQEMSEALRDEPPGAHGEVRRVRLSLAGPARYDYGGLVAMGLHDPQSGDVIVRGH